MRFDDAIGNWERYMREPEVRDRDVLCGSAERLYAGSEERVRGGGDKPAIYQTGYALKLERMIATLPPLERASWRLEHGFQAIDPRTQRHLTKDEDSRQAYVRARIRLALMWRQEQ